MRHRAILTAGAFALTLAGCAQPGYDAGKLRSQLEQAGATREQARCVTSTLENTFDIGQLASQSEPTAREAEKTRAILERCGIKNLQPPPSAQSS